jgi:hypothetical protein
MRYCYFKTRCSFSKRTKTPSPRRPKSKPGPPLLSPKLLPKPSGSISGVVSSRVFGGISGAASSI